MHLYERIFEELRRAIDEGEVGPGERLPSIREVAERYGCNKITAQKAFDLLAASGRSENRVGSGSYARFPSPPEARAGDFSAAVLSEDFFPYEEAGNILAALLARERGRVFSSPPPRGEEGLLAALARRFALPESSLLVTGGGQQGLDLVRRLITERGDPLVLVEEPTYPAALSLFRPRGAVAFGTAGPDPEEVDRFFSEPGPGPRLYFTIPEVHNPTGLRCSRERKRAIVEVARRRDVLIVEDDYLSELLPDPAPRFVDLAPERTIWIKSLSKTTAPGLRIGALSAPPAALERLERHRSESDPGPATWLQLFARGIIDSGLLDRHLAGVRPLVEARRAELLRLLARFSELAPLANGAGYNLWVRCPRPVALAQVPWSEGFRFGRDPQTRSAFRLSFMGIGGADWPSALLRLERSLSAVFGCEGGANPMTRASS